jgi:predicted RNase H-like nuclease (RuvC/YqgF family)
MKTLLTLIALFSFTNLFSQIEYPRFEKDSLGKLVVVMTVEQARELDNKAEGYELLKKIDKMNESANGVLIKIIGDKDKIIEELEIKIEKQGELLAIKDAQILNLGNQINNWAQKEKTFNKEIENKNEEIKILNEKINSQKNKLLFGGMGSGLIIVILAILIGV